MSSTFLVTGANAGLGFEAARQLALTPGVGKVVLACRNPERAAAAADKLAEVTGKPASFFEVLVMDTSDLASSRAAANKVQGPVHGLVLNAGGMPDDFAKPVASGATLGFAANVLGHAAFLQQQIADGKLADGARVVFSGSEAARGIPRMFLKQPRFADPPTADEFAKHISGEAYKPTAKMYPYGCAKAIGALYMSAMARKHPEFQFTTVSPGFTMGTEADRDMPWLLRKLTPYLAPIVLGRSNTHGTEFGAERYLQAVAGDLRESGKFFASALKRISGPLVDQSIDFALFKSEAAQDAAYEAVQRFL